MGAGCISPRTTIEFATMNALRRASIIAAAVPFGFIFVFGIVTTFARIPGLILVAVIFVSPLVSYVAGLAYGLRIGRTRDRVALGAQALGLVTLLVGVAWGLATVTPDDARIFSPDFVLVGVSYVCMVTGALALASRHERALDHQ